MKDRGIIKWQPFNSLIPSQILINSILKDKRKVKKPVLSLDQLYQLNNLVLECFYNNLEVNIKYYKNNQINFIKGQITKIDRNNQFIYVNDNLKLHFSQLLQIYT